MKCAYQGGIQENKNILNEVIQNANALRNEVNSYWTQLEEEGKEEVKHDYQLASDNYVNSYPAELKYMTSIKTDFS